LAASLTHSVAPLPSHAETTSPSYAPTRIGGVSMASSHANGLSFAPIFRVLVPAARRLL